MSEGRGRGGGGAVHVYEWHQDQKCKRVPFRPDRKATTMLTCTHHCHPRVKDTADSGAGMGLIVALTI